MNLLNKPFEQIVFQDVEDFCREQHIETTTLDYKKNVPKDLSKHIAAMSNTLGGIIIIGIEEESQTGLPIAWDGIDDKNKPIDQVYAFIANVKPYPSCQVRSTDKKNGKFFVLVEVLEGDVTPYFPVKDPTTVWLRTGNISTPLKPAERDVIELMYNKRERATQARSANLENAKELLDGVIKIAERERSVSEQAGGDVYGEDLTDKHGDALTLSLQPYYPHRSLTAPRQIKERIQDYRVSHQVEFPLIDLKATQGGAYASRASLRTGKIACDQLYANGLLWHFSDDILRENYGRQYLFVAYVALRLHAFLKAAQKFYVTFNYHGLLVGEVALRGIGQTVIRPIVPNGYMDFGDGILAVKSDILWLLELDTHIMGDDVVLQDYFIALLENIYWDLGIEEQKTNTIIRAWLKQMGCLVESS